METAPRGRRWTITAIVLLVGAVVLGAVAASCSGGDDGMRAASGPAAGSGPSDRDVAALAVPGADPDRGGDARTSSTTTSAVAGGGGATGPAGGATTQDGDGSGEPASAPLGPAECAPLERVVIPAAAEITAADFVPIDERELPDGSGDRAAAVARVAELVPPDQQARWERVAAQAARAVAEDRRPTPAERAELQAARNASEVWARAACPDAPPSWQCDHFGSIGGPDVAPTRPTGSSPEAVLAAASGSSDARVLVRTDALVVYGWVTPQGFVTRTQQVERVGAGWATTRRHVCHSG